VVSTRTDLPPSPALSILGKFKPTLTGRMVGCLVSEGADAAVVASLRSAVEKAGADFKVVAPTVGGVIASDGKVIEADFQLQGGPSVLFDAVTLAIGAPGADTLVQEAAAVAFVHDAFAHLKVIGHTEAAAGLLAKAGVMNDAGVLSLMPGSADGFVEAVKQGRIWGREAKVGAVH
jgi:catalase